MKNQFDSLPGNVRGTVFALAAAAMFTVVSALVKYAARDYHIMQILLARQLVMLVVISPVLVRHFPHSLKTERLALHLLRLAGALAALTLSFAAVANLPLATAISFSFTKTLFVTLFAVLMLGERVGWRRFLAIVVGMLGMLIMLRPDPGSAISVYAVLAIAGAAGAGLAVSCVRKLSATESTATLLSYQAIFVAACVAVPAIAVWKTPGAGGFAVLTAIGLISVLAQWLGVQSYRAGEVSVVTGMEFTKLIYAAALGIVVFSEWPDRKTLLGAAIIISASAFTIWRETKAKKAAP